MSKSNAADEFDFEPVANGVDFLAKAIEYLPASDPSSLKHAVLNLHAAAEVLVKVRLERVSWAHIVADEPVDFAAYQRGQFRSVTLGQAIRRLREHADIHLPRSHRKALERLEAERNKLQHYGGSGSILAIESVAGKALDVLAVFIRSYLIPDAPVDQATRLGEAEELIAAALKELTLLIHARLARIEPSLDTRFIINCPDCLQLTLSIEKDDPECLFCDRHWPPHWESGTDLASAVAENVLGRSWYEAITDGAELPVRTCPECELEALVQLVEVRGKGDMNVCFNCDLADLPGNFDSCTRCGELVHGDETLVCSNCWDAVMAGD
ncbi:hypothetical protein OG474_40850 [Kribbella sp. NBC_01505]|uniref:hypothetical protein n=1 Tax=Kribbella sp. NBC_01505 TaxID=2903580 RepID=UPI00386D89A0